MYVLIFNLSTKFLFVC